MTTFCPSSSTLQEDLSWFHIDTIEQVRQRPSEQIDEIVARGWSSIFTERQHGLVITRERILDTVLVADEGDDTATIETATRANRFLGLAYSHMPDRFFPIGWVSVTPNQDIRIEWKKGSRHVRLFVP